MQHMESRGWRRCTGAEADSGPKRWPGAESGQRCCAGVEALRRGSHPSATGRGAGGACLSRRPCPSTIGQESRQSYARLGFRQRRIGAKSGLAEGSGAQGGARLGEIAAARKEKHRNSYLAGGRWRAWPNPARELWIVNERHTLLLASQWGR
jgi:hypothetical protein